MHFFTNIEDHCWGISLLFDGIYGIHMFLAYGMRLWDSEFEYRCNYCEPTCYVLQYIMYICIVNY